jgi:hypothetical protein
VLSNQTVAEVLHKLRGNTRATLHGFRACLTDWCADETCFDEDTSERALAHAVRGTRKHYRHGVALRRRATLMQAWADYLAIGVTPAAVRPLEDRADARPATAPVRPAAAPVRLRLRRRRLAILRPAPEPAAA